MIQHSVSFDVPGVPIPKQSTRVVVNTHAKPHGILNYRMKAWQETVSVYANQEMKRQELSASRKPVKVSLDFRLPDNRRRDLDNLSKGTLDGLRGIVFMDDSQIDLLILSKSIDKDNPGVSIIVNLEME